MNIDSRLALSSHRRRSSIRPSQAFSLFDTPVFVFLLEGQEDLNGSLRDRLLAESQASPGIQCSNRDGWHSRPDLAQRSEPCFRGLVELTLEGVRAVFDEVARAGGVSADLSFRYAVQGWAVILRDGGHAVVHDHAEAHWSTVYYVDAGDADPEAHPDSGSLAFVSPNRGASSIAGLSLFPTTFTVQPRAGMLVIFPGWLQHYVQPYRGARPRISISCNVRMELARPGLEQQQR